MDDPTHGPARAIHLDALGGIAGDMFAAALLDAFPDLAARVLADVAAVLPDGCGPARLEPGFSAGIRCLRFGLAATPPPHHHGARHADLRARIAAAPLSPGTAQEATAILAHLARAEAQIHGVALDEVHFHEVGDWDSLADVVAAGSLAAALAPARWTVSPLPRGAGTVRTQHGLLPVPAPATLALLTGFAWRDDGIAGERVTPTGGAILRHLCTPGAPGAAGILAAVGTGAGTRDLPQMPNILRVTAFESEAGAGQGAGAGHGAVASLTFDIDDMTGEEIAVAADRLRAAPGVIDLTTQVLAGKKGRPACRFEILAAPAEAEALADAVFRETSTLGLRLRHERRLVLPRTARHRSGLRIKTATRPGGRRTAKAESDDLAPIPGLAARRAAAAAAETPEPDDA